MNISINKIEKMIEKFSKGNMKVFYLEKREEIFNLIEKLVPEKSTIGCGDSVTLEEIGLYDFFRNEKYIFLDKYRAGITKKEKQKNYIDNFDTDTFISSANAITEDGKIFNIDGNGSRIAPIIYGPKQVIIVVGTNKIVENIEEARDRARNIAAPLDAIRLGKKTPCASVKSCVDCNSHDRICNFFVEITGHFIKDRIKIIIINEKLGY
ncbi:lactate utilization protein [Fusobacterium sp. PH5-44]|uniref:lactate utilization protein n=1 Tax=unclassified Fusobacterium TaxID=2648384 RepID=UPI003D1F2AAE